MAKDKRPRHIPCEPTAEDLDIVEAAFAAADEPITTVISLEAPTKVTSSTCSHGRVSCALPH